jgi:CRISPR-associated protein Cas1
VKPLLNTLFVTSAGSYLSQEGESVCVTQEGEIKIRVPIHTLNGIVCFGQVSSSPYVMRLAADRGVGMTFLSENGRFLARVQGPVSGNVILRHHQYAAFYSAEASLAIARSAVLAKVANCRASLLRAIRESDEASAKKELDAVCLRLSRVGEEIASSGDIDTLRGYEGQAASLYFSVFNRLITAQDDQFKFKGRSRRPPLDNMNALLSFVYTLLTHEMVTALETVGLDPASGYLHRLRPGRPSLALDLVEELRPVMADRLATSLVNRRQVNSSGFRRSETGGIEMDEATRKEVLIAWQKRKAEELTHPFLKEKMPLGLVPFMQALLLARFLRGDLDAYPSFFWR